MDNTEAQPGARTTAPEAGDGDEDLQLSPVETPDASAPIPGNAPRDRIVVLGRSQAGKTIYLACLYHELWQDKADFSVQAITGDTHKACMEVIETLKQGRWPSSTTASRYFDLEVTYKGITRPLVSLDYPGEVFTKAFVDNVQEADVDELLQHIDQAAGVIALADPSVVAQADLVTASDDQFGLTKAIERIRMAPDGLDVPVALVLTKCDRHHNLIKSYGGGKAFIRDKYAQLISTAGDMGAFLASAVKEYNDGNQSTEPKFEPAGVAEPLRYVLRHLNEKDEEKADEDERQRRAEMARRAQQEQERKERRVTIIWTAVCAGTFGFIALVGFVTWWLVNQ